MQTRNDLTPKSSNSQEIGELPIQYDPTRVYEKAMHTATKLKYNEEDYLENTVNQDESIFDKNKDGASISVLMASQNAKRPSSHKKGEIVPGAPPS